MRAKDALGRQGEQVAAELLEAKGWTILERNWRCPAGELDIVARDGMTLVIVEVKTRRSNALGTPLDAVGPRKLRRLRELALHWLDEQQVYIPDIRFDVVGVLAPPEGAMVIEHVQGVA
ncbi:MAG: YraN family protein [Actinomycetales bacterium]|nr:YraN family protein [Actinomycetales bacterium]